ncbi:MAG: phosphate ABC transporter substrate-binding protein [Candidatus Omnitrophica bacterium]|nr:phosphate ABC transporter substrate-binding protein [Candidatus Omnitrophota bacterium]
MSRTFKLLTLVALIFSSLFGFSSLSYAEKTKMIQIKGSDTMVNLGQSWAEEYMQKYPDRSVAVTGGGSGTGISAIIAGTCDIAEASRNMTSGEKAKAEANGRKVKETTVAYDGIAVIVNPANPVSKLNIAQLGDIFTGKITNWSAVGGENKPFLILSRERNSGTHIFFLEHVLRRGKAKGPEEYATSALMMPSSQAIAEEVKSSQTAIGYIGLGYVNKDLKILEVAQAENEPFLIPSLDTVQDGTYKISRPLYFYTYENAGQDIQDFIQFALNPQGQEIVRTLDFVPLKKNV